MCKNGKCCYCCGLFKCLGSCFSTLFCCGCCKKRTPSDISRDPCPRQIVREYGGIADPLGDGVGIPRDIPHHVPGEASFTINSLPSSVTETSPLMDNWKESTSYHHLDRVSKYVNVKENVTVKKVGVDGVKWSKEPPSVIWLITKIGKRFKLNTFEVSRGKTETGVLIFAKRICPNCLHEVFTDKSSSGDYLTTPCKHVKCGSCEIEFCSVCLRVNEFGSPFNSYWGLNDKVKENQWDMEIEDIKEKEDPGVEFQYDKKELKELWKEKSVFRCWNWDKMGRDHTDAKLNHGVPCRLHGEKYGLEHFRKLVKENEEKMQAWIYPAQNPQNKKEWYVGKNEKFKQRYERFYKYRKVDL